MHTAQLRVMKQNSSMALSPRESTDIHERMIAQSGLLFNQGIQCNLTGSSVQAHARVRASVVLKLAGVQLQLPRWCDDNAQRFPDLDKARFWVFLAQAIATW